MKKAMILLVPAVLLFFVAGALFTGCRKREVAIPTQPEAPTDTPTVGTPLPTDTPTQSFTNTRTYTGTFTQTFTNTNTLQYTATPSWTPTHTLSPTNTLPPTNTSTATNTPTSTDTLPPTNTYTSTHTVPPTNTPTSCAAAYKTLYSFDTDSECWYVNDYADADMAHGCVLGWNGVTVSAAPGAMAVSATFSGTIQQKFQVEIEWPESHNIAGAILTFWVRFSPEARGTATSGAIQPFVQNVSTWDASWISLSQSDMTNGRAVTWTIPTNANTAQINKMGIQVFVGAGAGPGNVYIDEIKLTLPAGTPTPTPVCTFSLLNGCETIGENGTWAGTQSTRGIVTAPAAAITQGTSALAVTFSQSGWSQDVMSLSDFNTGIAGNTWVGVDQLKLSVYVPAGTFASWGQLLMVAVSDGTGGAGVGWDEALDGTSAFGLVTGMNTITINLDWAASAIDPTHVINRLVFIINGDQVVGTPIYIDNIQLIDCP